MPRRAAIVRPIEAWLATLDPQDVSLSESPVRFEFGDWAICLHPAAWKPELRGCPDNPFIGSHMGLGGYLNDVPQIRQAVTRKGQHYGTPHKPLMVAVLATNTFVRDREVMSALFGSEAVRVQIDTGATTPVRNPDGVWIGKSGSSGRRISAVLMGVGILPHTVATAWPRLWHHFDPTHTLAADLPFSTTRVSGNQLEFQEETRSAAEVLHLPPDWPGPEPAFTGCEHRPGDHADVASAG
jgi:hypothetical protein